MISFGFLYTFDLECDLGNGNMLGTSETNYQICQLLWKLVALRITSPVLRLSSVLQFNS